MGSVVLIYDKNEPDFAKMGPDYAKKIGATAYGVTDPVDLKQVLSKLKNIEKMVYYTHGDPGAILFVSGSALIAKRLRSEFSVGFDNLFAPGAEVQIFGCNVAAISAGCGLPAACSEHSNGIVFLKAFAQAFLKKGGRVSGSTAQGRALPFISSTPFHLGGTDVYAITNPNKKYYDGVRFAMGSELSTPYDKAWKVWDGKEYFYYDFYPLGTGGSPISGRVLWCTPDEFESHTRVDGEDLQGWDRRGRWQFDGDNLKIQWQAEIEIWDLPLFSDYQTGMTTSDNDFAFPGRPGMGGVGDVWAETVESPRYLINAVSD